MLKFTGRTDIYSLCVRAGDALGQIKLVTHDILGVSEAVFAAWVVCMV